MRRETNNHHPKAEGYRTLFTHYLTRFQHMSFLATPVNQRTSVGGLPSFLTGKTARCLI